MSAQPQFAPAAQHRMPPLTQIQGELMRRDFQKFCRGAWPVIESQPFQWNWHLDVICEYLVYVMSFDINRLMINTPFRSSKSTIASVMAQPWSWIDNPWLRWFTTSYDMKLATRDTLKSRLIISSPWYQERWGDRFMFMADQNEKSKYYNDKTGYRMAGATGTGAGTTGYGGHIRTIDDPHDVERIHSEALREKVTSWYDNAFLSRFERNAEDPIVMMGQRSHHLDLFGHVQAKYEDDWVIVTIPLEYDPKRIISLPSHGAFKDPRKKKGQLLDERRYTPKILTETRKGMTPSAWEAQANQNTKAEGGKYLKKSLWRRWPHDEPPTCMMVFQSYDTAFTEEQQGMKGTSAKRRRPPSYSARTTWGVFSWANEFDEHEDHLILLEHWRDRIHYPQLRKEAKAAAEIFDPDLVLVEGKASGLALIPEMRKARIPVRKVQVDGDKVWRAEKASLLLHHGRVWYMPFNWSELVLDLCAQFPEGEEDDTVDTVTQALNYIRTRSVIDLDDEQPSLEEELEDEHDTIQRKGRRGYG